MSYILDALNKADKERKQSATPASETIIATKPATQSNVVWFVALIIIVCIVALWFVFQSQEATKPIASAVSSAPTPTPIKPKSIPSKPAATVQTTTTFTPAAPQDIKKEPQPIPNIMGLDETIRNRLPAINISAHVFSQDATKRMVIINNQVVHEGDYIAADLKLSTIQQHGLELNFEGNTFTMRVKDKWPLGQ
ncbi:MAG: hypothetical protein COB79_03555 [Zetaproteobacteria bacterium]|nr:MAG: hypothetical protein COB79_03555 [Zetaproteobacteria bacterium]